MNVNYVYKKICYNFVPKMDITKAFDKITNNGSFIYYLLIIELLFRHGETCLTVCLSVSYKSRQLGRRLSLHPRSV